MPDVDREKGKPCQQITVTLKSVRKKNSSPCYNKMYIHAIGGVASSEGKLETSLPDTLRGLLIIVINMLWFLFFFLNPFSFVKKQSSRLGDLMNIGSRCLIVTDFQLQKSEQKISFYPLKGTYVIYYG